MASQQQRDDDAQYADAMLVEVLSEVAAIEAQIVKASSGSSEPSDTIEELLVDRLVRASTSSGAPDVTAFTFTATSGSDDASGSGNGSGSENKGPEAGDDAALEQEIVVIRLPRDEATKPKDSDDDSATAVTSKLNDIAPSSVVGATSDTTSDAVVAADPFEQWAIKGLRFPRTATDEIAAAAMRHQQRHGSQDNHAGHHRGMNDPPLLTLLPAIAACVLFFMVASWSQLRRSRRRMLDRHDDWIRDVDLMEAAYSDQAGPASSTH